MSLRRNECWRVGFVGSLVCAALWLAAGQAVAAEIWFVQAAKADLYQAPQLDSPKAGPPLVRGDKLDALERQGVWVKGQLGKRVGWVNRLFLSHTEPVGSAELQKDLPGSLEKASRRRSSSYAVSAASRGLITDERARTGRSIYRSDFDALEAMEHFALAPAKLKAFQTAGHLGGRP
jgi:hypothetical protein